MNESAWGRIIAHLDMDAFYASVEMKDDPSLAGKPLVVGGPPEKRGVVAAASYEARRFGIHSAMPMAKAVSLCPELIRLSPRMARYREESAVVMSELRGFSELVEPLALDEAFIDVSHHHTDPAELGRQLKSQVHSATGLTASVGVAPNKFVAKLASKAHKPNGLTVVAPEEAVAFVQDLPVEDMWGVGEKTAQKLHRLGIDSVLDVAQSEPSTLRRHFGVLGLRLHELSWARDDRPVVAEQEPKSISSELTFAKNQRSLELLEGTLTGLCKQVSGRLAKSNMVGKTVTIKMRYGDFSTITRQDTVGHHTDQAEEIFETAVRLLRLERETHDASVRLLGVGVSGLLHRSQLNLDLFGTPPRAESD